LFLVKDLGPLQGLFRKYFNEGIQVLPACDLGKVR
jgi:hypothetical protein